MIIKDAKINIAEWKSTNNKSATIKNISIISEKSNKSIAITPKIIRGISCDILRSNIDE